ncbi:hypothetical protein HDU67_006770 [Dinochytrium kinnereticum]|nr:hypothetical protein HDU67_006770 [Dinochytrium kinnereticum]
MNIHQQEDDGPQTSVVIGTRESQLAMVQASHVHSLLRDVHPKVVFRINGMTTTGDQILDVSLSKIGTKSLFTKELEVALADGAVDLVVHSLKDLPTTLPPGMIIGAILEREDPRDAVVMAPKWKGKTLAELPAGSVIGTSSVRRSAQLLRRFPGLQFQDIRGNLNTRLRKLDAEDSPYAAIMLAYAGLARLGWHDRISEILPHSTMLHAVGQGALAIEVRQNDPMTLALVSPLTDRNTLLRCSAERAFMRRLEGGCSVPLGVWSEVRDGGEVYLKGGVCSLDGQEEVVGEESGVVGGVGEVGVREAEEVGLRLAVSLIERGALDILAKIRK